MSTVQQPSVKAREFFDEAKTLFIQLYERWLDEQHHEDIQDYAKALSPIAEKCGVVIVKGTKRPFGVHFTVDNKVFHVFIRNTHYEYKRIG